MRSGGLGIERRGYAGRERTVDQLVGRRKLVQSRYEGPPRRFVTGEKMSNRRSLERGDSDPRLSALEEWRREGDGILVPLLFDGFARRLDRSDAIWRAGLGSALRRRRFGLRSWRYR